MPAKEILARIGNGGSGELAPRPAYEPEAIDRVALFRKESHASVPAKFAWAIDERSWKRDRARYEDFDVEASQRAGAAQDRNVLTLAGASGAGKTSTAVRIFAARLERMRWPLGFFVKPHAIVREQREGPTMRGAYPILARARSALVLVLDDLGHEMSGEWQKDVVALIHDRADNPKQQTIVTTELDEARVATRYGSGIARRLFAEAAVTFRGRQ